MVAILAFSMLPQLFVGIHIGNYSSGTGKNKVGPILYGIAVLICLVDITILAMGAEVLHLAGAMLIAGFLPVIILFGFFTPLKGLKFVGGFFLVIVTFIVLFVKSDADWLTEPFYLLDKGPGSPIPAYIALFLMYQNTFMMACFLYSRRLYNWYQIPPEIKAETNSPEVAIEKELKLLNARRQPEDLKRLEALTFQFNIGGFFLFEDELEQRKKIQEDVSRISAKVVERNRLVPWEPLAPVCENCMRRSVPKMIGEQKVAACPNCGNIHGLLTNVQLLTGQIGKCESRVDAGELVFDLWDGQANSVFPGDIEQLEICEYYYGDKLDHVIAAVISNWTNRFPAGTPGPSLKITGNPAFSDNALRQLKDFVRNPDVLIDHERHV